MGPCAWGAALDTALFLLAGRRDGAVRVQPHGAAEEGEGGGGGRQVSGTTRGDAAQRGAAGGAACHRPSPCVASSASASASASVAVVADAPPLLAHRAFVLPGVRLTTLPPSPTLARRGSGASSASSTCSTSSSTDESPRWRSSFGRCASSRQRKRRRARGNRRKSGGGSREKVKTRWARFLRKMGQCYWVHVVFKDCRKWSNSG